MKGHNPLHSKCPKHPLLWNRVCHLLLQLPLFLKIASPLLLELPQLLKLLLRGLSVIAAEIPSTVPLPAPATLLVGKEDSLKFSFEVKSSIGEASSDGPSLESTSIGPITPMINDGGTSPQISSSANSLLQLLAPYIMNIVQGRPLYRPFPWKLHPHR